jgi:hypothetical protein
MKLKVQNLMSNDKKKIKNQFKKKPKKIEVKLD